VVELDASLKGPENFHDPRPIMSPHICIILLLKLTKKDMKEEGRGIIHVK